MMSRIPLVLSAAALGLLLSLPGVAAACPFCSAVQVTFTEEIKNNDVAVIAKLVEHAPPPQENDSLSRALTKARFKVVEVLKGDKPVVPGVNFKAIYFGDAPVGTEFLIMGLAPPAVEWSAPIQLSDRGRRYIGELMKLKATGPDRLAFFQDYLQDADSLISRDAYDEFAITPYAELKKFKDRIQRDRLLTRLQDPSTDASHRRLYFTLLGVCGSEKDLPLLEKMLTSDRREDKLGLDALIGCYLTLRGEPGLPLIVDRYLKNDKVEFTDQHQAIMALRFIGEEGAVISKKRVAEAFHPMLDRPKYADLVVPDLARWEDWSVIDRLAELFRNADDDSLWVRVPVINYMRVCPLPKAQEYLAEFKKLDPKAYKQADGFFPLGAPKTSPVGEKPNPAASRAAAATATNAADDGKIAPTKAPPAKTDSNSKTSPAKTPSAKSTTSAPPTQSATSPRTAATAPAQSVSPVPVAIPTPPSASSSSDPVRPTSLILPVFVAFVVSGLVFWWTGKTNSSPAS